MRKLSDIQRILFLLCLTFLSTAREAPVALAEERFAPPEYIHNIYYACGRPAMFRGDKCVYDSSSRERMEQIIGELAALGVNAITFHSVYRAEGGAYDPKNPQLARSPYWPKEMRPVEDFLDLCQKYKIAGYLAVYLGSRASGYFQDPRLAAMAEDDILAVFGKHPAFKGFVPPIEANANNGLVTDTFLSLCKRIRDARPDLKIMDYPNGLFSGAILQSVMRRSLSGNVDIENIQFHSADERLTGFAEARGLTLLIMGACPAIKSIVHTHYKYGVGKQWLAPQDAYKVSQGATITATAHGTSIFSFLHGFWGIAVPGDSDALGRRVKWYEGILNTQRMAPFLAEAQNMAHIAIMIPYDSPAGGIDLVRMTYNPLARAHLPAAFFVNQKNLPETAQLVLVPFLSACGADQLQLLAEFTRKGGTLVVLSCGREEKQVPANLSKRALKVLGFEQPEADTSGVDAAFLKAARFQEFEPLKEPVETAYGAGAVAVVPGTIEWGRENLPSFILKKLPDISVVRNLPEGYLVEKWRTTGGSEIMLFLATEEGQEARDVVVSPGKGVKPMCAVGPDTVAPVAPPAADGTVVLPEIGDCFSILVSGDYNLPILMPGLRVVRCKAGDTLAARCVLYNPLRQRIDGEMKLAAPERWPVEKPAAAIGVEPGTIREIEFTVRVPKQVEKKPYFLRFEMMGLAQRTMVFPEDGRPQEITKLKEMPAEWIPRATQATGAKPKPKIIGTDWISVTAGPDDNNVVMNTPGVCFHPGREWDAPAEFQGKLCRFGEVIPVTVGGPNFLVNGPDRSADMGVRITYWAESPGLVRVYDGEKYHDVGRLEETGRWAEAAFTVPRKLFDTPKADRIQLGGFNVMFDIQAPGVHIHKMEVRQK